MIIGYFLLCLLLKQSIPDLLASAHALCEYESNSSYKWLDDRVFLQSKAGYDGLLMSKVDSIDSRKSPVPTLLNKQVQNRVVVQFVISPDSKWLLSYGPERVDILSFDGTKTYRHSSTPKTRFFCTNALWLPDSKSWVALAALKNNGIGLVVSGIKPNSKKTFSLADTDGMSFSLTGIQPGILLGCISKKEILFFGGRGLFPVRSEFRSGYPLIRLNFENGNESVDWIKPSFYEAGSVVESISYSRAKNRLAWLVCSPVREYARELPNLYRYRCITSDLKGGNIHILGETQINVSGKIHNFEWMPSQNRISFAYNHKIWTLPAD